MLQSYILIQVIEVGVIMDLVRIGHHLADGVDFLLGAFLGHLIQPVSSLQPFLEGHLHSFHHRRYTVL